MKMKCSIIFKVCSLVFLFALSLPRILFAELDPRTREYVSPVRIVTSSPGIKNAEKLLSPKFAQVPEGRFPAGSGAIIEKGGWVLIDFGLELHGSLQIGNGQNSGKNAKARIRFGESVSEAMALPGGGKVEVRVERNADGTSKLTVKAPPGIRVIK